MKIAGNKLIVECSTYDFKIKLEAKEPESWGKSISAFANGNGEDWPLYVLEMRAFQPPLISYTTLFLREAIAVGIR